PVLAEDLHVHGFRARARQRIHGSDDLAHAHGLGAVGAGTDPAVEIPEIRPGRQRAFAFAPEIAADVVLDGIQHPVRVPLALGLQGVGLAHGDRPSRVATARAGRDAVTALAPPGRGPAGVRAWPQPPRRANPSRAAATVAAMSSSVCAALTKPASYSAGAMHTPRSSRPWNSTLKRAPSLSITAA